MQLNILSLKKIIELTIKELKSFFDGLYGYILIFIFLLIAYFMFLQSFFIVGNASLSQLFSMIPVYMIVFIPAITMSSFARESDKQTIEYVLTKPVKTLEVIIGKILASTIFAFSAVLLTLPLHFTIAQVGRIDAGETAAGYLASFMLILAFSSIGVSISSFFKNQISAFLVTCTIFFGMFLLGSSIASANLPLGVTNFLSNFAVNTYFSSIIRGVLDIGDLLFFVLLTLVSIVVAKVNIDRFRIANLKKLIKNSIIFVGTSTLLIFWMIYMSRSFEYRFDLTQSTKYTLSPITKEILKSEGKTKIEVYASTEMPEQFKYTLDEIKNQLRDYQAVAGNNIEIQYIDPKDKEKELQELGISPIQFNVIGNDQFQAKNGYLAIVIKNEAGDKVESIPYVNDINNLEYQIVRLINKVKAKEPSKLGIASGNGEYSQFSDFSTFFQILSDNFTVESIFIPGKDIEGDVKAKTDTKPDLNLEGYSVLLIANPTVRYTDESITTIKNFMNNGGKVIFVVDPNLIDMSIGASVMPYEEGKSAQLDLFSDLGITIESNMIYDLKSRSTVTVRTQNNMPLSIPYPFFPMLTQSDRSIAYAPDQIMAEWPSSLKIEGDAWKVIYKTSDRSGAVTTTYNLDPAQEFSSENLKSYPIIALREFENGGKLVVSGNARMFTDAYLKNSESNILFALSLSESLSNNAGLSQIKSKNLYNSQFTNIEDQEKTLIRFGTPIISIVLLALIGFSRILRKNMLEKKIKAEIGL